MFTGIVEETGVVSEIKHAAQSIEFTVRTRRCGSGLKIGDSLAVNGCCLTVAKIRSESKSKLARFDLLQETWRRTNLQFANAGAAVNLERSLRMSDRFGGHFVTGHIDETGRITRLDRNGQDWLLELEPPQSLMRYVVSKGAIAVDGISLTVAAVSKRRFQIWIIPHTWEVTALRERGVGDAVNLEVDILSKYVEKLSASKA